MLYVQGPHMLFVQRIANILTRVQSPTVFASDGLFVKAFQPC